MSTPLLAVRDLRVAYTTPGGGLFGRGRKVDVVHGVSFDLAAGEVLGLVGESGSGKSTLARAILRLTPAHAGSVHLDGHDWMQVDGEELRVLRQHAQMVFQDPFAALDPRMSVHEIVAEPLRNYAAARAMSAADANGQSNNSATIDAQVRKALARVGLGEELAGRRPGELSGGQCQRVGIARAIILRPRLLICDEPVSALDVSVRAQIVDLFRELQESLGLAILFIAHDLAVVRSISDRILVMLQGRIMESASADELCEKPLHPYTAALLRAVPVAQPQIQRARLQAGAAEALQPLAPEVAGSGCVYRARCSHATRQCGQSEPPLRGIDSRQVACHHAETIAPAGAGEAGGPVHDEVS